jgi:hypothetical protein
MLKGDETNPAPHLGTVESLLFLLVRVGGPRVWAALLFALRVIQWIESVCRGGRS